jgi:hypothetical protein
MSYMAWGHPCEDPLNECFTLMADVHPNCIFNFTKRFDALKGILAGSFNVSYAREKIVGKGRSIQFAVPMVLFCDIKLSDIQYHITSYGKYGIGISKEWAVRSGLNPVMYPSKRSDIAVDLIAEAKRISSTMGESIDSASRKNAKKSLMHSFNVLRYVKNYQGDNLRADRTTTRDYRFANGRGCRFIPPMNSTTRPLLSLDDVGTADQKAAWNAKISTLKLSFEPKDIKYIIIPSDDSSERQLVIDEISKIYGAAAQHMASRILSVDQILNDI